MNQLTTRTKSHSEFGVQDTRVQISPVGLVLHGEVSFDEWRQLGPNLAMLERSMRWSIADWINYGEVRYGEKYAQALSETGLEYGYLANLSWLARSVPISRRREELGLSHHAVVAPLPDDQQDLWLQYAIDNELNRSDFRNAVKLALQNSDTSSETAKIRPLSHDRLTELVLLMLRARKSNKGEVFDDVLRELMEVYEQWI